MNKGLIGIIVLALGVGIGWYVLKGSSQPATTGNTQKTSETSETSEEAPGTGYDVPSTDTGASMEGTDKGGVVATTSVSYSDNGFSPKTITVKKGTAVRWTNTGGSAMWVASAMHPTHQVLAGFDQLKSVGSNGTYEYTFSKVGTWQYHNHMMASHTATVVVTE